MHLPETVPQDSQDPLEGGWIPLAPVHLFPWLLLGIDFLQDLLQAFLPYEFGAWILAAWGFTVLRWALGGVALGVAFQEPPLGPGRRTAFGLAAALLGLRVGLSLAAHFGVHVGTNHYNGWSIPYALLTVLGLGALMLLLLQREADAGGRSDAAVASLLLAGGLGWMGLPVLAVMAGRGHPLLAAQWEALRNPKEALAGGWFDGLDEGVRLRNLGACSLALALLFPVRIGHLMLTAAPGRAGSSMWWTLVEVLSALLASLVLGVHVLRAAHRAGSRKGHGPALAAVLISGLPLLLLLVAAVFLALVLMDVIHFRLF